MPVSLATVPRTRFSSARLHIPRIASLTRANSIIEPASAKFLGHIEEFCNSHGDTDVGSSYLSYSNYDVVKATLSQLQDDQCGNVQELFGVVGRYIRL